MHNFTPSQRSKLLANKNVQDVTEKSITFNVEFKIKAINQFLAGISPSKIFEDAGIPLEYFKEDYCRCCLKRWLKKLETQGVGSLSEDRRGSGSTGRPKSERPEDLTYEELLALVEIQKEALEELKKQNALARKKKR
jgi:transposase